MDENSPAARFALGASAIRRRIFGLLMAEPELRLHLREIQRRARTTPGTASRELGRLVAAGLVDREAEGHQVYFKVASTPYAAAFRTLLRPEPVPPFPAGDAEASSDHRDPTPPASRPAEPAAATTVARPPRTILAPTPRAHRPDPLGLKAAARLAEVLRPIYAGRLIGVYLYGARARGDAAPDTEIEVAVVLDEISRYGEELERTSLTCAGLTLEYGVLVSRLFVPESVWKGRADGQLPAIRLEAVAV